MKRIFSSKALWIAGIAVLMAQPLWAQTYDFVGIVQDGQRGESLAGVEISMPDGRKLGTSQSTGRFEVSVNNRRAHVIFRHKGYKDLDVDMGEIPNLIDVEISMESDVQELADVTTYTKRPNHDPSQAQSIEELESLQGMRIDLNDHLRQLHGVAGMGEFTNDISVNGSRTQDVTHYLGHSHIPSLRHLDFGFPGNQSLLNPRLLKSVTLADNQAKGPLNQGNASALVYDLQDGDPEALHGNVVIGSVDREANLSGYWDGRTWLASGRYLDNSVLTNLGSKFFTDAKRGKCDSGQVCPALTDPLIFTSGDLFLGTFYRDSTGAFARHSLIVLSDDFEVNDDVGQNSSQSEGRVLVGGKQGAFLYSYENVTPSPSGDWEWGLSALLRDYEDSFSDLLAPAHNADPGLPGWYRNGNGNEEVTFLMGDNGQKDRQVITSGQYSPTAKTFGAQPSYGVELDYHNQNRSFLDNPTFAASETVIKRDLVLANAQYRLHWNLPSKRGLDASVGLVSGYDAPFSGGQSALVTPLPLGSVRYTHPLGADHKVFAEIAERQSTEFEPTGIDSLHVKSTPSAEILFGGDGILGSSFRYAWSGYTRLYFNPLLPVPEVYWNYEETRASDYARVSGTNGTVNWLPSHHFGIGVNGSVIQGNYHMKDGSSLAWEANRTLDVSSNVRILPRDDSLFSIILTYNVANGKPLYEYRGLWDTAGGGTITRHRSVYQSTTVPEASRQRFDARFNIDLKSHWHPLESMRFFFEADNIFQNFESGWAAALGGGNQRQRGWTRDNASGDLQPVVTRGLGFFIMFGLEGQLKI